MKKELPANFDKLRHYPLSEAVALIPQLSTSKFTGGVDIDVILNVSPKQKNEAVRGSVVLPTPVSAGVRVIAFADEKDAAAALAAGATAAGLEKLVSQVEKGEIEFDVVVATPTVMSQIAKLGRVLGPKGLMPNPNNGTISADIAKAVESFLAGKMSFKMDGQGAVRGKLGRTDMTSEQLEANTTEFLRAVYQAARKLNQQPFRKIMLSPTMGSAVRLDPAEILQSVA